jgi:hypothetical protein
MKPQFNNPTLPAGTYVLRSLADKSAFYLSSNGTLETTLDPGKARRFSHHYLSGMGDPSKNQIALRKDISSLTDAYTGGDYERAIKLAENLLEKHPGWVNISNIISESKLVLNNPKHVPNICSLYGHMNESKFRGAYWSWAEHWEAVPVAKLKAVRAEIEKAAKEKAKKLAAKTESKPATKPKARR